MRQPMFRVDAFVLERPFSGNPAGVCPLERWLDDATMLGIAAENNLSETAFFVTGTDGPIPLRWFTPTVEVNLCGHATLASAHVLFQHLAYPRERLVFTSKSGELAVERDGDALALDFPAWTARPHDVPGLAQALRARPAAVLASHDLLVVFETEAEVRALDPDLAALALLPFHAVIATAPGREVDFVSRFFAPGFGVPEDPVTGRAHCTLTPYWAARLGKRDLTARQLSTRGGALWCGDRGARVRIAGRARTTLEGAIVGY